MKKIDMIVKTHHMYTMKGDGVGYEEDKAVAVDKGKIIAVDTKGEIEKEYEAEEVIDGSDYIVLPGLIDAHMHTTSCALRGIAQDVGNWMMHGAGPFLTNATRQTRAASGRLGIAEAVLNGTTTIGDEGPYEGPVCEFVNEIGVRGNIGCRIRSAIDRVYAPGELYDYDKDYNDQTLGEAKEIFKKWHMAGNGRIRVMFAPQGPDFVSEETLYEAQQLARENNTYMYMHLAQGDRETKQMMMRYGKRSIDWLIERGLLDDRFIGIHLTIAQEDEVKKVVEHGARMVVCSTAIGVIDGIVPPAKQFQDFGGRVALGSDQANGNNEHNIFNEMRMTAILNKVKYEDPEVMPCWKVLRMATIEGAKALGLDDVTGSIEVGKDADMILVRTDVPAMQPIYTRPMRNIVPNLVYAATGRDVDTVISGGKVIVRSRKPQTFDLEKIFAEAQAAADDLVPAAEAKFWEVNGANARYMKEGKL
mgnify:FL=1